MISFRATFKHPLFQAFLLIILVWGTYWNSLHNPYEFDDWHVIPQNHSVRGPENIPSFFVDVSTFSLLPGNRDYRPLFLTSMALSWWAGGGDTLPFHITSISLHMGNVLLLFGILRVFLRRETQLGLESPFFHIQGIPLLSAAIFALHPLASESVNYISSQAVPLAVFFYLLSFYGFLLTYSEVEPSRNHGFRLVLAISYLAFFLALLAKPIAISLPLMLLLWDLIYGKPLFAKWPIPWNTLTTRILKHLPYWLITLVYLGIRKVVIPPPPVESIREVRSAFIHYLTQTKAMVEYYLGHSVWPKGLNVDREYPLAGSIFDPGVLLALAFMVSIGYLLFRFRHNKFLLFWSLWFPSGLLLTTYIVILGQVVNEHRVYLSLAGFCAVAGFLLIALWQAPSFPKNHTPFGAAWLKPVVLLAIFGLLLGLAYETRGRNHVWSSDLTLWEDAALHEGTWRAHMNYALALEDAGRADEALFQFEEAVRLGPYAFAHLNLGFAHVKRHNMETGLAHLRTAVRLWPTLPEAHLYLAYGLGENGNLVEAEQEYRQALGLRPNYMKAYHFLATFYEKHGRLTEAIASLKQLQALDPGQVWVGNRIAMLQNQQPAQDTRQLFNEAFAFQKQGQIDQAIARYEQLIQQDPHHTQAMFNLAYAYLHHGNAGEWERSTILFSKVLELAPNYVEAMFHLASAFWKLGKEKEAVHWDQLYIQKGPHQDLRKVSTERLASMRIPASPSPAQ